MKKNNVLNLKNLRRENAPYIIIWIIYYAWVIVFTTWWTASPLTDSVYGIQIRSSLHKINLISSALCVFAFKREWFVTVSRIGSVCLLAASVLFMTLGSAEYQLATIILFGISLGVVNAGILMPFVFVLNNTEKFYSIVIANLLISIMVLLQELNILNITNGFLFSYIMLLVALSMTLFFKKDDLLSVLPKNKLPVPSESKILFFTCIINVCYAVFCKGVGRAFLNVSESQTDIALAPLYYIGGIVGCLVYAVIYRFSERANHATWNVTFGNFVVAMFMYALGNGKVSILIPFSFLIGIASTMGMINMYYILGVVGKKYQSMKYIRLSVLFIGVGGGISGIVLGGIVTSANSDTASVIIAIVSCALVVAFLVISPTLTSSYYSDDWAEDSCLLDVDSDKLSRLRQYGLSNREIQVCQLLTAGYTMRQTAAILGISYNTVNTYCTSLYRKLNINSRIELVNHLKENG